MTEKQITLNVAHAVTWLTLLTLVGGAFVFYEGLHEGYVTKQELEVILLKRDNERLHDITDYEHSDDD